MNPSTATARDRHRPRLQGRRPRPGRLRPQGDRARRARDARPDVHPGGVRRLAAARRRPDHGLAAHDGPDRGADRDPRRARRRGALGLAATSSRPRTTPPRPSPSAPTAPRGPAGRPGLRLEGRDARGVLGCTRAGAAVAGRRGPEHDPRRRWRRHDARPQGHRVREGRRRARPSTGRGGGVAGRPRPAQALARGGSRAWTKVGEGIMGVTEETTTGVTGSTRWPRPATCCSRRSTSTTRSPSRSSTTSTAAGTR